MMNIYRRTGRYAVLWVVVYNVHTVALIETIITIVIHFATTFYEYIARVLYKTLLVQLLIKFETNLKLYVETHVHVLGIFL